MGSVSVQHSCPTTWSPISQPNAFLMWLTSKCTTQPRQKQFNLTPKKTRLWCHSKYSLKKEVKATKALTFGYVTIYVSILIIFPIPFNIVAFFDFIYVFFSYLSVLSSIASYNLCANSCFPSCFHPAPIPPCILFESCSNSSFHPAWIMFQFLLQLVWILFLFLFQSCFNPVSILVCFMEREYQTMGSILVQIRCRP